jgi:hypothetical protein
MLRQKKSKSQQEKKTFEPTADKRKIKADCAVAFSAVHGLLLQLLLCCCRRCHLRRPLIVAVLAFALALKSE